MPLNQAVSRRRLLGLAASAAVAWQVSPWVKDVAHAVTKAALGEPQLVVQTLEAFADTLIPGEKRWPGDRVIAGAAPGAGAVQAGAINMMEFPATGISPLLPGLASLINTRAEEYAARHAVVLDPAVAPMVALDFSQRTELLLEMLAPQQTDYLVWFALTGIVFLAFHTAGFLHTADAIADHHPGLEAIGFPPPGADGIWRFPDFSYRRRLASTYPGTAPSGSPP